MLSPAAPATLIAMLRAVPDGVCQLSGDHAREIKLAPAIPTKLDVAKTVRPPGTLAVG